jgi:hypothetical protein
VNAPATTLVERPPPGPARGLFPAPVWLVLALALGLAIGAGLSLGRAWRRRAK